MTAVDLAAAMPGVALALLGKPVRHLSTAHEWRYGRRGSLSVDVARGLWRDHEAGTGGGVIALIQRERGGDAASALRWLDSGPRHWVVTNQPSRQQPPLARPEVNAKRICYAVAIWDKAARPKGTLVEAYLASRRLSLDVLGEAPWTRLRFAQSCPFGPGVRLPAMLALLTDLATGAPVGIRRTALTLAGERACDEEGKKLPHKVLGRAGGAVVRLGGGCVPPAVLRLCEGVETGLSIIAATGAAPWACPAGMLAKVPVIDTASGLAIYADNDPAGLAAAQMTARRWRGAGRHVTIQAPDRAGADFNDLWMEYHHG